MLPPQKELSTFKGLQAALAHEFVLPQTFMDVTALYLIVEPLHHSVTFLSLCSCTLV